MTQVDLPDWAAWSWREDANHIMLSIGLALRDIGQAQEVEADATPPPGLPSWVHTSELDITLVDGLLQHEPLANVG